ncbi:hypothetical protein QAD02_016617 [Eretmocerus hayati]|uniref:Uncharacterized protein n=1 Tax=Eretmocerus hayati TaxID=131215 RepID=A0ACC2PB60_9HYME|nr:hypothetical protein QAD02_016617 [Eretmocerus hayati]
MEKKETRRGKNPRASASILSILTFKWLFGIFRTGFIRELEETDLFSTLDEHSSQFLGNKLSQFWERERERCQKLNSSRQPSLLRVLIKCFGYDFLWIGLILATYTFAVRITQPIVLAHLLNHLNGDPNFDKKEAFFWGSIIVLGLFLDAMISYPAYQGLSHIGMKMRVACSSLMYKKVLKVSVAATKEKTSLGQMVNLLSNDVSRLDFAMICIHDIWIAPLQLVFVCYLMYREIGVAAIPGVFVALLFMPIPVFCGKYISKLVSKLASKTDKRLRLTSEIINGVKVIKMYAWEKPFARLVDDARREEVKLVKKYFLAKKMTWSLETYVHRICIFVTFLVYIIRGHDINAEKAFMLIAFFDILRNTLYSAFPLGIQSLAQALVSIKRVQNFLLLEEIQYKFSSNNIFRDEKVLEKPSEALLLRDVHVKWDAENETETLKDMSFTLDFGSLTAVIGRVGSGKTTLLNTILQEAPWITGEIKINGKISYASQVPWLFTSTVRQNILFGLPLNEERYKKVIEVCQLSQDFESFPFGDNSLIGEKGLNLSGGQCARVNLARAVYRQADIYLLDDPLSALDTRVGRRVFKDCIKTFLKDKTIILVTHQFQFLKDVDKIIVLVNDGISQVKENYAELINSGLDLAEMLTVESQSEDVDMDVVITVRENITHVKEASNKIEEVEREQAEDRKYGDISLNTYKGYFAAAQDSWLLFFVAFTTAIFQIPSVASDYLVTNWVNTKTITLIKADEDDTWKRDRWYILAYGSLIVVIVIVIFAQLFLYFEMTMRISRNLYVAMFKSIIQTKMSFFNANPVGRILNRFSQDMEVVDKSMSSAIQNMLQMFLYAFLVVGVIASVNPWFLVPAVILTTMAYFLRSFYIQTSRSMKRLEGITKSPVFSHLSNSVHGLSTVRALDAQNILMEEFDNHQNLHSTAWFISFSGSRAFGMYIDTFCSIFVAIVVYVMIIFGENTLAGNVGLVITQGIIVKNYLQWAARESAQLESHLTSVERVLEYSELPKEKNLESTPETKVPEKWPENGKITFKNVSLTYERQTMPALKNLDFTVEPNQMIGIVGRTGAGKSSIVNALLRFTDIEGDIYIDDHATSEIALQDLRSRISIIPQEPMLFSGTLRWNLDPLNKHSDEDLWQALQDVELKQAIDPVMGLSMSITAGGSNLSVGQRQLVCLARAILRNNTILVLDEATANVDPRTDELIQKTIRKKFDGSTVFIIAHRLNTVMDCNKILVVEAGEVVEYDHPFILLEKESGILHSMVQQNGASTATALLQIAETVCDPYRWLENPDSNGTKNFIRAQNSVTERFLKAYPKRQLIIDRLTKMWNYKKYSVPTKEGNKYYFYMNTGLQNQDVLYVQDCLGGKPRIFLDPNTLSTDGTVAASKGQFSPDGSLYAYFQSTSGSDWRTLHLINTTTGEKLLEILGKIKFSLIAWTHDNKGFFYSSYPQGDRKLVNIETRRDLNQKLSYHKVGTPQSHDVVVAEFPDHPDTIM